MWIPGVFTYIYIYVYVLRLMQSAFMPQHYGIQYRRFKTFELAVAANRILRITTTTECVRPLREASVIPGLP